MKINTRKSIKDTKRKESKIKNKIKDNDINDEIDREIDENIEKEKLLQIQKEREKEEFLSIIKLLKKEKDKRAKADIIIIKDYLCSHIDYFKNLLEQSEEKLLKLVHSLNYEMFMTNERIMNFGEKGNKCFILLKGKVGIYKPFPITKEMTLRDYVEYLVKVRDNEKNIPKFERIINYNSKIDKIKLYAIDFDYTKIPKTDYRISIIGEEERELAQATPGKLFGEMALIKNEPRNASIIALEKCAILSIEKNDYLRFVKDIEEQRINKELNSFKQNYPIFGHWPPSKCFRLLSGFINEEFAKDDYVYRQNDIPSYIYLIKEGKFEITTNFNFNWYENFINYIHDSSLSLFNDMDNPIVWKEDKITKKINEAYKENYSPFSFKRNPINKVIISNQEINDENKDLAKEIEDEMDHNKNQVYKANIQKLESPNSFGFLEIFELKYRLCSVKCISKKGIIMKFPLLEFLQLIPTDKRNQFYFQEIIFKEKKNIIAQLKNSILTKLNFIKKEENNNFYISKHFFENNNNTHTNIKKLDFKRNYIKCFNNNLTPLKDIYFSNEMTSRPQLNKSKSLGFYNISKNDKKENLGYFNEHLNNNKISNNSKKFEERKHNSKKGIFLGFKNSIIKLTKDKMEVIKGLFPKENTKKQNSLSLNIKTINKSDKEYVKFLGNNLDLSIKPKNLRDINISPTNGMTGKKYINLDTNKFVNKLNKSINKTKSTNESKIEPKIILPYINNVRSPMRINYEIN